MIYDFDAIIDRRHSNSEKWNAYGEDVLPLWVADMDFYSSAPIMRALRERVEHGVFGYGEDPLELRQVLVHRLYARYGWKVLPEDLVFLPGVAQGFHVSCHAFAAAGDGVLVQTPMYRPILHAHEQAGLASDQAALTRQADGSYTVDLDAFERAITPRTRLWILCNPHNPVGRVFRRDELEAMARICLRHGVLICSDEIHCDLVFSGRQHVPIASIAPEIAARTITLISPSKTFNIAGLRLAVAIIQDPALRKDFVALQRPLAGSPNVLAVAAALAAYRDSQDWLDQALSYLEANRDFLGQYVRERLPMLHANSPEATYLTWLDCRQAGIPEITPCDFFLNKARVAVNDGASFGPGGEGFVRVNFGCPRATLVEALERMKVALAAL
jgi:cystathionine beta-lyase